MWLERMHGQGRAALLWGIGFFALAQLGLMFAIERWRPDWRDPQYGFRFRNLSRQIHKAPERPLMIVLGSSRIGNGFKADCLPPPDWKGKESPLIFNMSLAGATPTYELLLLHRLLAANIHPRWMVIEILPPCLNWEEKNLALPEQVPANRLQSSDLEILDRYAARGRWNRTRKWLKTCLVPWYSNRYVLLSRYAPSLLEPAKTFEVQFWRHSLTSKGWLPFPLTTVTREQHENWFRVARDHYTPTLANFRVCPEADLLIREMLETCRQEKIEVLGLLLMPEGRDFRDLYSSEACQTMDAYLHALCREFNIQLIDARTWMADDCFSDGHHLLPGGAEKFSLRLWRDALEPQLQGQEPSAR